MLQIQPSLEQQILWQELEDAAQIPEEADLRFLCQMLDEAIALVPEHLRLRVVGEAFVQLANIYAARASSLLDAWERSYNSTGPVLTPEGLADLLVRQSLHLDLDDLVQVPEHKYVRSGELSGSVAGDSIIGYVTPDVLLEALEHQLLEDAQDEETAKALALDVAHHEDVENWVKAIGRSPRSAIASFLQAHAINSLSFMDLQQALGMELVEVWLGLLHSQDYCQLQQCGDFYQRCAIKILYPI